jgi:hypothetical protein
MAGISGIRKVAKLMGDTSSLKGGGDASVPSQLLGRGARRGFGSQIGPLQGGLSIWGLVMYAEFLTFLKRLMDKKAEHEVYLASAATYAAAWEFGHRNAFLEAIGANPWVSPRPYFFRAPLEVQKAFAKGDILGRGARRMAGRASASFFWGTLMRPGNNPVHAFMEMVRMQVRRNIKEMALIDTGVLRESFMLGDTLEEALENSRKAIIDRLGKKGRIHERARRIMQEAKTGGPHSIGARIDDASRIPRIIPKYGP